MSFMLKTYINGLERNIRLRPLDSSKYGNRNLLLKQNPANFNADTNVYDVLDLTDGATVDGYIPLPDVNDLNKNQEWDFVSMYISKIRNFRQGHE